MKTWFIDGYKIREVYYMNELHAFDIFDSKGRYLDTFHPLDRDEMEKYILQLNEGLILNEIQNNRCWEV